LGIWKNVVYGKEVVDYILSKQEKVLTLEQVYSIKNAIENRMLERGSSTDMWHIRMLGMLTKPHADP